MNQDRSSVDRLLLRLAEVENEKEQIKLRLSAGREQRKLDRAQRQPERYQDLQTNLRREGKPTSNLSSQPKQSSSPLLNFLIEYERYVPIFDGIYRQLDIRDVLTISRTCKKLKKFYHNMIPSKWNINRRLARFVNDPKEFRTRLGIADALISGTFALLFFAQLYWLDSGLDIYVRQGSKADALIRYIGEDTDYAFDYSYGWSDNDDQRTLAKVLVFYRRGPPSSPQIRFHLTHTLPLHSILTDCAFSTAHVNVISWNKAYCMFPHTTFVNRRMFFLHKPDEALGQILSKYSAHGWRSTDWIDYDPVKGCLQPGIRDNIRRVGDSSTWVIPLNLDRVKAPNTPDIVLENCTFQIYADQGPQESDNALVGLKTFSIGSHDFSCCMLKHSYNFHSPDSGWTIFLRNRLSRMSMLEILKTGDPNLQAQVRRADFAFDDHKHCPLLRTMPRFSRPKGWEYADHLIPDWFAEWKKSRDNGTENLAPHPLGVVRSKFHQKQRSKSLMLLKVPPRTSSISGGRNLPLTAKPERNLTTPPTSSKSDCFPISQRDREVHQPSTQQQPLTNLLQRSKSDYSGLPSRLNQPPAPPLPLPSQQHQVSPQASRDMALPRRRRPTEVYATSSQWPLRTPSFQTETPLPPPPAIPRSQILKPTIPRRREASASLPSVAPTEDYFSFSHRRQNAVIPPPPLRLLRTPMQDSDPLHPDLLTPPPDIPPPPVPPRHSSRTVRSSRDNSLPVSPAGKRVQVVNVRKRSALEDMVVYDVPEHLNFI